MTHPADRPAPPLSAALRPAARRRALMAGAAGAVLLGAGTPAWAAGCTSSGQTAFSTDSANTELCLSPDSQAAATASGPYAIAIGSGSQATSSGTTQGVIDYRTTPNGEVTLPNSAQGAPDMVSGTAIGQGTVVGPAGGVGIGYNNTAGAGGFMGVAVGANNAASGAYGVAIGQANVASGTSTVAQGTANQATGNRAVAIGRQNYAFGDQSIAQGFVSSAYGDDSIALGDMAVAGTASSTTTAVRDIAIGRGAQATGGSSIAFGANAIATSADALAIGTNALANGGKAVSIGTGNTATGDGAVAIGDPSTASGTGAFAGGANNQVYGEGAVGIGNGNAVNTSGAPANGTVALGDGNTAAGQGSVALGFRSTADGIGALAFGDSAAATHAGGVALGSGAVDGAAVQQNGTYPQATSGPITLGFNNASGVNAGTVSVGSGSGANAYRQVQNVADGSAAHDAVTMEQLASVADQANGAIAPLQSAAKLAVQYTADSNGNPTNAVDLTRGGALGNVALTGLAPATTSTGAVALGQMPLQYATAGAPTTANPGTASDDATLVGSGGGPVGLHNLAPGSLDAASTDAVNGAQLHAAGSSVATVFGGGAAYDTATGRVSQPSYTVQGQAYHDVGSAFGAVDNSLGALQARSGALASDNTSGAPDALASGRDALAAGFGAAATGAGSAVLGNGATDNGNADSTVLGLRASIASNTPGSNVALGQGSVASSGAATNYAAYGLAIPQSAIGEVSVGAAGAARRITNVAAARDAGDAVNLAQLEGAVGALPVQYATAADPTVPSPGVASQDVTLVGAGSGPVALHNLAAGTLSASSTDAVNGAQLYATGTTVASALGGGAVYDAATGRLTGPRYVVAGQTYADVGSALGALDGSVNGGGGIKYFHANSSLADSTATGQDAVAAGPAALASGAGGVAIGRGAASTGTNSVALGAGSSDGGQADVVSVGAPGAERRITNVAAGTLAAGSTDAATAGQLYAGGSSVATILGGGAVYDAATGTVSAPGYTIGGARYGTVGGALSALDGSVNGGAGIKYFHANSTLADSAASGTDAVAMGPAASAAGSAGVAIGAGAASTGTGSVALGAGSTDGGQADVVSVGAPGAERRITNVAAGTLAAGSTDAVTGGQLYQTNQQVAALGHAAVQYDTGANGRTLSTISLASDAGGPVVIHNLAPGTAPTDAANVGQLNAATANAVRYDTSGGMRTNTVSFAGGQAGPVTLQNVGPGVNGTDAVNVNQLNAAAGATLGQSQAYTDARVSNLAALTEQALQGARSEAAAGTAAALAASGLRYDDRPGRTAVAGAASYYHGQSGLAFGLGHTAADGQLRFNAAVTVSPTMARPEVGAVVGGSWSFN